MLGLLLLACFATGTSQHAITATFVTVEDFVAFVTGAAYVGYYCIRVQLDARRVNAVNPILASIGITVQRVYGSAENPYSQTLTFMMLVWLLHKMSVLNAKAWLAESLSAKKQWWRWVDIAADCTLLSVMLYAGALGQVGAVLFADAIRAMRCNSERCNLSQTQCTFLFFNQI